jgi:hypothetical protein
MSKIQWNKYVAESGVLDTNKMYYGKYPYRAELNIPGCWLLHNLPKNFNLEFFENKVKERKLKYANSGSFVAPRSWQNLREREIMDSEPVQLFMLANLRRDRKDIRTRIENTTYHIYAETEKVLTEILDSTVNIGQYVKKICRPPINTPVMDVNTIYMKKPQHKFKVTLRESEFSNDTKKQIIDYLNNFPESVTIPYGLNDRLHSDRLAYMSGYYFIDDEQVLPFLRMISPNFVKNIYRIEKL